MGKFLHKIVLSAFLFGLLTASTLAAECSWLPDFLCRLVGSGNPVTIVETRVRAAFFIAIGAIILIAIAYGLYNAYKYVKSGGGDGVEEANKGMRSILLGIGSIFVILLGIAAVLMFFGASFLQVMLAPTCVSSPDGAGCYACQHQGMSNNATTCAACNSNPNSTALMTVQPKSSEVRLQYDKNEDGQIDSSEQVGVTVIVNSKCKMLIKEVNK